MANKRGVGELVGKCPFQRLISRAWGHTKATAKLFFFFFLSRYLTRLFLFFNLLFLIGNSSEGKIGNSSEGEIGNSSDGESNSSDGESNSS